MSGQSQIPNVSASNRSTWAIVDNLPPLRKKDDFQRLATILQTVAFECKRRNSPIKPLIWIPYDTVNVDKFSVDTQIKGFGLIAFAYKDELIKFLDTWRMHNDMRSLVRIINIMSYNDYQELKKLGSKYNKMTKDEYFESRNLIWWLFDKAGKERFRDQFLLRYRAQDEETKIYWLEELVKSKKELSYGGEREKADKKIMTNLYVQWSKEGMYLVTMHNKGIQLWGGPEWLILHKLQHDHVQFVDFSPGDKFVVTCNAEENRAGGEQQAKQDARTKLIIWDTLTGKLKRPFDFEKIGPTIKARHKGWWPIIHWSYDAKYFAKISSSKKMAAKPKDYDKINIYSTSDMRQLDNMAHDAPSLYNIAFSPSDDYLAYSTVHNENDPASVSIIKLPTKEHARASQVLGFDIGSAHLYWQSEGKFLAVKMGTFLSKKNRSIGEHSIGIVCVKKPGMPYMKSQGFNLGKIELFHWEPNSSRFAILHGNKQRTHVSFFNVTEHGSVKLLFTLENRRMNTIKWAPQGGRCVLAFVEPPRAAQIEFVDVNSYFTHSETVTVEHNSCHEISWDPSGRYLVSCASQAIGSASGDDTGYKLWSFQGQLIFEEKIRNFYQFMWRPRPLSMLNSKDIQRVKSKELRQYSKIFDACDKEVLLAETSEKIKKNMKKQEIWEKKYDAKNNRALFDYQRDIENTRAKLLSHYKVDRVHDYEVTTTEEEINVEYDNHVISKETLNKIINGERIDFNNLDDNGNEMSNNMSNNTPNKPDINEREGYIQGQGRGPWNQR